MNLINKLKKRKLDNKGFSLVELIIVIAIMAILIGVVGSQVVPYLERSKEAKDKQVLSSLCTDATSAFSMNADKIEAGKAYKVTISDSADLKVEKNGADVSSATDGAAIISTLKELRGVTGDLKLDGALKLESKAGDALSSITIDYSAEGKVTVDGGTTLGTVESK